MAGEPISLGMERLLKKQKLFQRGAVLLAACSGGADSLAMTSALQQVGQDEGWQIFVCHVQHHLRGAEAERDALFVEKFCKERKLPFIRCDVDVNSLAAKKKISVEEAARELRYRALKDECQKLKAFAIVTGHHQDDQAETVLMNLLRGAGTRGLRGMQTKNGLIVRPFLGVTRKEMEDYCKQQGTEWCTDSSNECVDYRRNSIRKELLPLLEKYNPQIKRVLATTAYLAAQDEDYLEQLAQEYLKKNCKSKDERCGLCVKEFAELAPALSTRVLMLWFQKVAEIKHNQLERKHVEALLHLVKNGRSGALLTLPGVRVEYAYGFLLLSEVAETGSKKHFSEMLPVPGRLRLPDGRWLSSELVIGEQPAYAKNRAVYPRSLVAGIIKVRNRENGDRFRPKGSGAKKLKEYLIDKKMPSAERDELLLVCADNEVIWLIGGQTAVWKADKTFEEWLLFELSEGG
ncbi:MAG: tRNA lysidine(34) synthetase TilS [Acidaminococcaceae bacterium]